MRRITIEDDRQTLLGLCLKYTGTKETVDQLLALNPHLTGATQQLKVGDLIMLPEVVFQTRVKQLKDAKILNGVPGGSSPGSGGGGGSQPALGAFSKAFSKAFN